MSHFTYLTILAMLFGLFGCNAKGKKDFVFDEFKSQIEKYGMRIDSVDATELIYISQGETTLKVSLDNVRKNYARDKDTSHISDLVQTLVSYSIELPSKWTEVNNDIYISLFPNDYEFNDVLHSKVTDEFSKVYVHSGQGKLTWITAGDLKKWNITAADLDKQANSNADKLLSLTPISFDTVENRKLGLIEVEHASLKAALLFAPSMKEKVKKDFGFPFFAVIPVRDFCYIFQKKILISFLLKLVR
jgi:hypothetical protein